MAAPLPLVEDVWAMCDSCEKWRRLPPGTVPPPDNLPWYCTLNPDRTRNTCAAPEETYVEVGGVEAIQPVVEPKPKGGKKGGSASKGGSSSAKKGGGASAKKGGSVSDKKKRPKSVEMEEDLYLTGGSKGRKSMGSPVKDVGRPRRAVQLKEDYCMPSQEPPHHFPSLNEELKSLVSACEQIMANMGSWVAVRQGGALTSQHLQLPSWLWDGLHHFAPQAAAAAAAAIDVLTAGEYSEDVPMMGQQASTSPSELLTRLALTTAASATLPLAKAKMAVGGKQGSKQQHRYDSSSMLGLPAPDASNVMLDDSFFGGWQPH